MKPHPAPHLVARSTSCWTCRAADPGTRLGGDRGVALSLRHGMVGGPGEGCAPGLHPKPGAHAGSPSRRPWRPDHQGGAPVLVARRAVDRILLDTTDWPALAALDRIDLEPGDAAEARTGRPRGSGQAPPCRGPCWPSRPWFAVGCRRRARSRATTTGRSGCRRADRDRRRLRGRDVDHVAGQSAESLCRGPIRARARRRAAPVLRRLRPASRARHDQPPRDRRGRDTGSSEPVLDPGVHPPIRSSSRMKALSSCCRRRLPPTGCCCTRRLNSLGAGGRPRRCSTFRQSMRQSSSTAARGGCSRHDWIVARITTCSSGMRASSPDHGRRTRGIRSRLTLVPHGRGARHRVGRKALPPSQDDSHGYGGRVVVNEVEVLTARAFVERSIRWIEPPEVRRTQTACTPCPGPGPGRSSTGIRDTSSRRRSNVMSPVGWVDDARTSHRREPGNPSRPDLCRFPDALAARGVPGPA